MPYCRIQGVMFLWARGELDRLQSILLTSANHEPAKQQRVGLQYSEYNYAWKWKFFGEY